VSTAVTSLIIWGHPPTISPWRRFYSYFTAAWAEGKPEEGIPFTLDMESST